ncbi:putative LIM-domain binding protein [Lyophyllum shimeji]|uniref:LIM-domain binding protein n=1 Tax=Lyophyllum shimeji TaxID=47721 RepID=A0A9P3PD92_LYOSH|nr:putative LIM-domain binding protein [Lyophyllum shimeji]
MNGNVHPDMLRQGLPQQTMLSMNAPFMPNIQPSGPQTMSASHLGIPSSSNAPNPAMMLNNPPGLMNPAQQHRYQLQMQPGADGRPPRPMQMRQGQPGQPMMGPSGAPVPGGGGGPHMVGMGSGQTMPFNPGMMSQPPGNMTVRRVSSQPQMSQGPGSMAGMSPNVVNNNLAMGMSSQGAMSQMRQIPQAMQNQIRMQTQGHMQNQMAPDMPMPMNRPGPNPGLPGRTGSAQAQLMNSLSQPPSMQHPIGPHQNQFQNPMQIPSQHPPQIPSPRPGSHSQTHTPSMTMATPGPSRTPVNRPPMNPDDPAMSFMNYPNPQFGQTQHTPRMQPTADGQFPPFVPSSTPPISMSDMPQPMSGGLTTPGSSAGGRMGFPLTPAQQLEQMNNNNNANNTPENFASFNMPPPSHVPPRPSSRLNPHAPPLPQQQQLSHHSPHSSDPQHMNPHPLPHPHPPRPQSQPQIPRPSSSQRPHTPRSAHPQIPPGAPPPAPPGNRMSLPGPHGPPPPTSQMQVVPGAGSGPQHLSIAPRPPPQAVVTAGGAVGPPPSAQAPGDTPPTAAAPIPRPQHPPVQPLGNGQGLIRLLNFSGVLAAENKTQKLQLSWWSETIKEYFTPKAMLKFTLWKDNQRNEAKPFEIGVPILPRFFLVTTQSGVKSMTLSLDGARERMYSPGHSIVECVAAIWTYKYTNGYTVTLRGPLTVHVVVTAAVPPGQARPQAAPEFLLKFEEFQFDANFHDKYIALDAIVGPRTIGSPKTPRVRNTPAPSMPNGSGSGTPAGSQGQSHQQQQLEEDKRWEEPRVTIEQATIPGEPVNAFGIPQATMRCLELAESVSAMADLIAFSTEQQLGPLDALKKFAARIRESQQLNPAPPHLNNNNANIPPNPFGPMQNNSNMQSTPAVTLYSSAPPSVTNPSNNPASTVLGGMGSPQNVPASAGNSPQKQHKTIPQQQQTAGASSSSTAPGSSPAVSSGATNNTPALAHASLKRKQGPETASPTTVNAETQPPAKRQTRRRRTTNAAGAGGG